ncbi:MAG: carbon-nitrogen hydrolase family protein [Fimbriimonadaceae bacterium]
MIVTAAQISPVVLDRDATIQKITASIAEAAREGSQLIAFGETFLPGYPFWVDQIPNPTFENSHQKAVHARYLTESVDLAAGHLNPICEAAKINKIFVVIGIAERVGHTLFASCVTINDEGTILNVHRKLCATFEERLCWGNGDAQGLRVFQCHDFHLGSLNCWENWMPLARTALYEQGENLHVAIWPGSDKLTRDITRFVAKESRSFVLSAGGILNWSDVPADLPGIEPKSGWIQNGGSCLAGPDGEWIGEPITEREGLFHWDIEIERVLEERQNFDPVGHYARPDLLKLEIDHKRIHSLRTTNDSQNV